MSNQPYPSSERNERNEAHLPEEVFHRFQQEKAAKGKVVYIATRKGWDLPKAEQRAAMPAVAIPTPEIPASPQVKTIPTPATEQAVMAQQARDMLADLPQTPNPLFYPDGKTDDEKPSAQIIEFPMPQDYQERKAA